MWSQQRLRFQTPAGPISSTRGYKPKDGLWGGLERSLVSLPCRVLRPRVSLHLKRHRTTEHPLPSVLCLQQIQVLILFSQSPWTSSHMHEGQAARNHDQLRAPKEEEHGKHREAARACPRARRGWERPREAGGSAQQCPRPEGHLPSL